MKIVYTNHCLEFTKGWTLDKLLKGQGEDVEPLEISGSEVLADVVTDEDEDYVDFVNLDINTDKAYRLMLALRNASASAGSFYLYINEVYTSTFYRMQYLTGDGAVISAGRGTSPSFVLLSVGGSALSIVNIIKDVNGYYRANIHNCQEPATEMKTQIRAISSTFVTDNITSIRVSVHASGALGEGSRLLLTKPRTG